MIFSGIKPYGLVYNRIKPKCHTINLSSQDLSNPNCGGRDRLCFINLWCLFNSSQLRRWRSCRQLPLGVLSNTLLELNKDLLKVNAKAFKVSNLFHKVGRKLHLGEVDCALLKHRDGCLDAAFRITNLAKSCLSTGLLEVSLSNRPGVCGQHSLPGFQARGKLIQRLAEIASFHSNLAQTRRSLPNSRQHLPFLLWRDILGFSLIDNLGKLKHLPGQLKVAGVLGCRGVRLAWRISLHLNILNIRIFIRTLSKVMHGEKIVGVEMLIESLGDVTRDSNLFLLFQLCRAFNLR